MSAADARFSVGVFLLLFIVVLLSLPAPARAFTCSDGQESHAASQAEADSASPKGSIVAGQSQVCATDAAAGITAQAGQAKSDLAGMRCKGNENIEKLDAKFAVCADKFMQQLRQASPGACVRDGFRSEQEQAAACMRICGQLSCRGKCAPPGRSYHQKGLAIDVNYRTSNSQAWQIAASVGIVNPSGLHNSDPNHFQSANNNCAGVPVPTGDRGDYYNDTGGFYGSGLPFDNSLRGAFGMPPPPPPPPIQSTPITTAATTQTQTMSATSTTNPPPLGTLNTTPYPTGTCAPQTYCYQQDGNIYYRASTCVDSVYQQCTKGCNGLNSCNATSTTSGTSPLSGLITVDNSNSNGNSNLSTSSASNFDLIDFFANGGGLSATAIGTATPIDINEAIQSGDNASVLVPTSSSGIIQTPPQGTHSSLYVPTQQETFTSQNLSGYTFYGPFAQNTFRAQILAQMKAVLLAMLPYVQPFGTTMNSQAQI